MTSPTMMLPSGVPSRTKTCPGCLGRGQLGYDGDNQACKSRTWWSVVWHLPHMAALGPTKLWLTQRPTLKFNDNPFPTMDPVRPHNTCISSPLRFIPRHSIVGTVYLDRSLRSQYNQPFSR